jgi:xylulokinase
MDAVLAIDLGGSSLRAGLVGPDGAILAMVARAHHTGEEAAPAAWWEMLLEVVAELPRARVAAIVPGGFGRSQVLTDALGMPVRPAQCFADGRAAVDSALLTRVVRGTWLDMNGFHPIARLAWVRRNDPGAFLRTRHVLTPKDWLVQRMTGRFATDRISNAWALERRGNVRSLALFRRARLDAGLLPQLLDPWEEVGPCTGLPGLAGVPVLCGAMDTWFASLGVGAGAPGDAYLISGTTDAGGVLTDAPQEAEGLVTLPWGPGLFHTGGPSGAGADCLRWLGEVLGQDDPEAMAALAEHARPDAPPLLFLPALAGERAPGWSARSRGAFMGLDRSHGVADMARAVMEGVAFADRDLLGGLPFDRVLLGGGGARSDAWCRMRADALGCPVVRAASPQPGLLGAAMLGWASVGRFPTVAAAQAAMAQGGETFRHEPAHLARMQRLYEGFKAMQAASATLARVVHGV